MVTKDAQHIERMFSAIAPRYDLLNRLLSIGIDRRWRKLAVRTLSPDGGLYLDLAAGTGDMAIEITRQSRTARVITTDFSHRMLAIGARKTAGKPVSHGRGDAMELSFRQNSFNGITCAFGIRNFLDLKKGVKEMLRVLKPGGRVAILEFTTPDNPFIKKIYLFYFGRVVPLIGRIVSGHHNAYSYLPASVREFPDRQKLKSIFTDAGFQEVSVSPLTFGVCDLITANKPASADKALRRGGPEK